MLELAVTISLIVLLLTLSSIAYRRANKRTEVILTAQQIVSTLRLAQSYAASSKEIDDNADYNIWGVYFDEIDNSRITMFVDKNKDGMYSGLTEKYKIIEMPKQIKVDSLLYDDRNDSSPTQVSITFVPPDPKVRMCSHTSGNCTDNWATNWSEPWDSFYLILGDAFNNSVKDIHVNFFGLIDSR